MRAKGFDFRNDQRLYDWLAGWNSTRFRRGIDLIKSDLVPRMDEIATCHHLVTEQTGLTCQITTPGFRSKAMGVSDSLERWRRQGRHVTSLAHVEDSIAGIPVWEMMQSEMSRHGISIVRIVVESNNTIQVVRYHADVRFGSIEAFATCLRGMVHRLVLDGYLARNTVTELDHAVYRGSWFAGIEM